MLAAQQESSVAKRIAVIDDDPAFAEVLEELLAEEGYTPQVFQAGMPDLPAVRTFRPDAIVLDIRMCSPQGGWEILAALQQDALFSATPIIICSADIRQPQDHAASWESRGYRTLGKPFDLDVLLGLLREVVGGPSAP
jgi:DNA-binding response OmpR family regulator